MEYGAGVRALDERRLYPGLRTFTFALILAIAFGIEAYYLAEFRQGKKDRPDFWASANSTAGFDRVKSATDNLLATFNGSHNAQDQRDALLALNSKMPPYTTSGYLTKASSHGDWDDLIALETQIGQYALAAVGGLHVVNKCFIAMDDYKKEGGADTIPPVLKPLFVAGVTGGASFAALGIVPLLGPGSQLWRFSTAPTPWLLYVSNNVVVMSASFNMVEWLRECNLSRKYRMYAVIVPICISAVYQLCVVFLASTVTPMLAHLYMAVHVSFVCSLLTCLWHKVYPKQNNE